MCLWQKMMKYSINRGSCFVRAYSSLCVVLLLCNISLCMGATPPNANATGEESVFRINFNPLTSNIPTSSEIIPSLTGISLAVSPAFWGVKGSFYFCVYSDTAENLNRNRGLKWVAKNNNVYSSFGLLNWTYYETESDSSLAEESLVFDHGSFTEQRILAKNMTTLKPLQKVKTRFCYVPDPWSLISDERGASNQYRIEKELSGTYYFEAIENAVVYYGSIPLNELVEDWADPIYSQVAPLHLVVTSSRNEEYNFRVSSHPLRLRMLLPRCVQLGLYLRCFYYFYMVSGTPLSGFNVTFTHPYTFLDAPSSGDEDPYILVNNDKLVFHSEPLQKQASESGLEYSEMLGLCTFNYRDFSREDIKHEALRNFRFGSVATWNTSRNSVKNAAAVIYKSTQSIQTLAMGVSYETVVADSVIQWSGEQKAYASFEHEIPFQGPYSMRCTLTSLPPTDLPRLHELRGSQDSRRNYMEYFEILLNKNDDYLKLVFVSRAPHVRARVPREGLGITIPSHSRFLLVDLMNMCTRDTIVEVEDAVEQREYAESSSYEARWNEKEGTCHKLFVPTNGSQLAPNNLHLFAYLSNETRPKLGSSGVLPSTSLATYYIIGAALCILYTLFNL